MNKIFCGDCREILSTLQEGSIDLVVTSPPYWGLRDYGSTNLIWGGDTECEHEWLENKYQKTHNHGVGSKTLQGGKANVDSGWYKGTSTINITNNSCVKCGAWCGSLGLEPHPQMFIDHLVEVSRHIKQVLKPRGSFWLNLGDTYYGSGKGAGTPLEDAKEVYIMDRSSVPKQKHRSNWLQPKQLLGIPWRVASALQHDGWILRNCVIWYKPNHMPESVKDRLTKSYEFFFFLVKQRKYYFNLDAIREPLADSLLIRMEYPRYAEGSKGQEQKYSIIKNEYTKHQIATGRIGHPNGKNPGDVWEIPTQPFPGSHFAVFPPALIEPIIKASSPKKGVVLDPFAGSGTTLRVARKLGRRFIGIELNPEYAEMCRRRIQGDNYTPPPEGVIKLTEAWE